MSRRKNKKKLQSKKELKLDDVKTMTVGKVKELTGKHQVVKDEAFSEKSLAERLQEKIHQERITDSQNNILDQYIKSHKEDYKGPKWEEGIGSAIVHGKVQRLEEVEPASKEKDTSVKKESKPFPKETFQVSPTPQLDEDDHVTLEKEFEANKEDYEKPVSSPLKKAIIIAVILLITGSGIYLGVQTYKTSLEKEKSVQLAKDKSTLEKLAQTIPDFYTDHTKTFVKNSKMGDIGKLQAELSALKDAPLYKEVKEQVDLLAKKIKLTETVNEIFEKPAIIDGKLQKDLAILSLKKIAEPTMLAQDDGLDKLAKQAVATANTQYDTYSKLDKKIKDLASHLTDKNAGETFTTLEKEVKQVKSNAIKMDFEQQLKEIKEKLTKSQKEAAEKQAEEEKKQKEQEQSSTSNENTENNSESHSQDSGTDSNESGVDNQAYASDNVASSVYEDSIIPYNQAAINARYNEAWAWGEGIMEHVIDVCISRGYIGKTGWSLNPVNIINGNGYYNLIASDGRYLVTINAKTGWFQGRGTYGKKPLDYDPATATYFK